MFETKRQREKNSYQRKKEWAQQTTQIKPFSRASTHTKCISFDDIQQRYSSFFRGFFLTLSFCPRSILKIGTNFYCQSGRIKSHIPWKYLCAHVAFDHIIVAFNFISKPFYGRVLWALYALNVNISGKCVWTVTYSCWYSARVSSKSFSVCGECFCSI